jgi:hypothetical protein
MRVARDPGISAKPSEPQTSSFDLAPISAIIGGV